MISISGDGLAGRRALPSSVTFFLLATVLVAKTLVREAESRDPNYAVEIEPLDEKARLANTYRLVSLNWLNYLSSSSSRDDDNDDNQRRPTKEIYFKIVSLPDRMKLGRVSKNKQQQQQQPTYTIYDNNRSAKEQLVRQVFEAVFTRYVRLMDIRQPVRLYANAVDPIGVRLKRDGRDADKPNSSSEYSFNRTIVISFEDPPYGQSRVNRLVTSRNIPWTVWNGVNTDDFRFARAYNVSQDLIYRYFHNIGHLLGYGHYVGSRSVSDRGGDSVPLQRSIMYANINDPRFIATTPVRNGVDERSFPLIRREYSKMIDTNAERFVASKLTTSYYYLMEAAARVA